MSDRAAARHPDIPQDGLFDEPERVVRRKPRPVKPRGHGQCPRCGAEKVAQILETTVGQHGASRLVWKQHHRTTWGGKPIPCSESGQEVTPA